MPFQRREPTARILAATCWAQSSQDVVSDSSGTLKGRPIAPGRPRRNGFQVSLYEKRDADSAKEFRCTECLKKSNVR